MTRNRILGPEATGFKTMGGKKKGKKTWVRDRIELGCDRTRVSRVLPVNQAHTKSVTDDVSVCDRERRRERLRKVGRVEEIESERGIAILIVLRK